MTCNPIGRPVSPLKSGRVSVGVWNAVQIRMYSELPVLARPSGGSPMLLGVTSTSYWRNISSNSARQLEITSCACRYCSYVHDADPRNLSDKEELSLSA